MTGPSEESVQILRQQLAMNETLAAARDRQSVPTEDQNQPQHYTGMKGELDHEIPTFLDPEKKRDHETRQYTPQRPFCQRAQTHQRVKSKIVERVYQEATIERVEENQTHRDEKTERHVDARA